MWQKLLCIGLAGACGTLARYGLSGLLQRWAGSGFPWGTLGVNALGCLAFGVVWSLASIRMSLSPELRAILLVGFLGAFTTFSTFVSESGQLVADGEYLRALCNVLLQNGIGLVLFAAGMALGRLL
ncbi:MAG: fluoride efflux transporter CrcB [Lentisphaeria bacterium]|nr:fluoride efflux transporter CrcB [Lentisphaeria bacterium]